MARNVFAVGPGNGDGSPASLATQFWASSCIRGIRGGKRCYMAFISSPNGRITTLVPRIMKKNYNIYSRELCTFKKKVWDATRPLWKPNA